MIFREVEKIKIKKKLRKNQNFQKIFFFAARNLMNLAGVQHQYCDTSSLRRKPVHTFSRQDTDIGVCMIKCLRNSKESQDFRDFTIFAQLARGRST